MEIEGLRSSETTRRELKTPYCIAFLEEAAKKIPENLTPMRVILEEIDKQAVDNFKLFEPQKFPGTKISFTKLSVTKDLVKRIAATDPIQTSPTLEDETEIGTANEEAFLFTAMGIPPDGNAFTAQDKDPLTTTPARIVKVALRRIKTQVPMEQKGRSLEISINRTHIFIYENFPRFNQIINYCKTLNSNSRH